MNLSQRLLCIASKVKMGSKLIDIGTDHGYVPIYLHERKVIERAIACDVSKGSCDKAQGNINQHGLGEMIRVIVSDGLKKINTTEFDTILIAGMGGRLMADILEDGKDKLEGIKTLILQPQTEIEGMRRKIHTLGYKIVDESIIYEDKKYYNIIVAEVGKEVYNKNVEYCFGKLLLDRKDIILRDFLEFELTKDKEICAHLGDVGTDNATGRINEIRDHMKRIEEVLEGDDFK